MSRLDILFISTTDSKRIYQDLSKDFSAIEPPIWAGMLTSHCIKHGFDAQILDCEALCLGHEQAASQIKKMNPRVACFVVYGQQPSASSQNMHGMVALAEVVRSTCGGDVKILFVGGHIAALPRDVLASHSCIDMVCQNEGVYTISNLLKTNLKDKLDKIAGLGYRDDGNIILNGPSPIVSKRRSVKRTSRYCLG